MSKELENAELRDKLDEIKRYAKTCLDFAEKEQCRCGQFVGFITPFGIAMRIMEAEKENAELRERLAEHETLNRRYRDSQKICNDLLKINSELRERLAFILPMAKGYAAEHPVGSNQAIVNEAQEALKEDER